MNFEDLQRKWAAQFRDPAEGGGTPGEGELLRRVHEGERGFRALIRLRVLRDLALLAAFLLSAWMMAHHAVLAHAAFLRLRKAFSVTIGLAVLLTVLSARLAARLDLWWTAGGAGDRPRLSSSILRDRDRFDALILWRDLREVVAGIFVVSLAVYQARSSVPAQFPGLAWAAAAVFAVSVTGFLTYRLRSREKAPPWDGTLVGMLTVSIHQTRRQIRLLENLWWYAGPCYVGFLLGQPIRMALVKRGIHLPEVAAAASMLALCLGLWFWNRWTARRRLQPRLEHLEGLRAELVGN